MQSTGHSSIHALSLMSTQGSAIVYVTEVSAISCQWCCQSFGRARRKVAAKYPLPLLGHASQCALTSTSPVKGSAWLLILDVAHTARLERHLLLASRRPVASSLARNGL